MRNFILIAVLGAALTGGLSAGQPQGGDFVITKSTIDGGGGTSVGGDFVLTGTIGQPDASQQSSTGGNYAVAGGFWASIGELVIELIFEDGFE
jgi:hypothetical protein